MHDEKDQSLQAMFQALQGDTLIHGIAFIRIDGNEGQSIILYDHSDKPLDGLFTSLEKMASMKASKPSTWKALPLPDKSGKVSLPEGWKIKNAYRGLLEAEGEQGLIELGHASSVNALENVPHYHSGKFQDMAAPYSTPSTSLESLFPQISQQQVALGGQPMKWVRQIENIPVHTPSGQGAYVYYEWDYLQPGKVERRQSLAFINTVPLNAETWMFYMSAVSAPSNSFLTNLPTLLEIWKSWKVADWAHSEQVLEALQKHQDVYQTTQAIYQAQKLTDEKMWKTWKAYSSGKQALWDKTSNGIFKANGKEMAQLIKELNASEIAGRYTQFDIFKLD